MLSKWSTQTPVPGVERYLTASDARRLTLSREETQHQVVEYLVRNIERKIKTAASMNNRDTFTSIPPFHVDLPPYNLDDIITRLVKHFTDAGFYVKALNEVIYISWRYESQQIAVASTKEKKHTKRKHKHKKSKTNVSQAALQESPASAAPNRASRQS